MIHYVMYRDQISIYFQIQSLFCWSVDWTNTLASNFGVTLYNKVSFVNFYS